MNFAEFIKKKRLEANLSLRRFCELIEIDPSNWSKIERNKMVAPEKHILERIAQVLNFETGSRNWQDLFNYAAIAKQKIPDYVYSDEEVIAALPIFFRTANGSKPTEEEMNKIIELLKGR